MLLSITVSLCFSVVLLIRFLFPSVTCHCSIMEGEQFLKKHSPALRVQDPSIGHAVSLLPPVILFHGTEDSSIPSESRLECLQKKMLSTQAVLQSLDIFDALLCGCFSIALSCF